MDDRHILFLGIIFAVLVAVAVYVNLEIPEYKTVTIQNKSSFENPGGLQVVVFDGVMYYPESQGIYSSLKVGGSYNVTVVRGDRIVSSNPMI